jgi:hypothetical protein
MDVSPTFPLPPVSPGIGVIGVFEWCCGSSPPCGTLPVLMCSVTRLVWVGLLVSLAALRAWKILSSHVLSLVDGIRHVDGGVVSSLIGICRPCSTSRVLWGHTARITRKSTIGVDPGALPPSRSLIPSVVLTLACHQPFLLPAGFILRHVVDLHFSQAITGPPWAKAPAIK